MTGKSSGRQQIVPIPPDGDWGWVVVIGSFFIHVFADGFVYSFGVLNTELIKEFGVSNATLSLIISLLTGLTLGSGPVASAVCNKYGCRTTAITGSFIALIGCICAYFATAMWQLIASVGVIMGIGFGLMYCPAIVIVTMYFEKKRSLATGIAVAGAGVGTILFSPINSFLIKNFGWRGVFLAFMIVLVLSALCGATFAPLQFVVVAEQEEEEEYEDEVFEAPEKKTYAEAVKNVEHSALLPPPVALERSLSQHDGIQEIAKKVRPSTSMEELDCEPQPRSRRGTVGERDCGYLNRKDVFYTGSISNVAEFRENPDKYRSTGTLDKEEKLEKADELCLTEKENHEGGNMFKTISNMLSLDLLLDPIFLLFAISNLLTSVGFNSPLYFLPLHAAAINLDAEQGAEQGAKALAVFGAANTIGRIVFGVISDHKLPLPSGLGDDTARNRLWIYNISLTVCGILTALCYKFVGYTQLCVYTASFGFTIASYICLTSVILVDILGLDKLTNAFGLLLLWQGIGTILGPLVSGYLADLTGSYTISFVFCGINLFVSGLMLFAIPFLKKKADVPPTKC